MNADPFADRRGVVHLFLPGAATSLCRAESAEDCGRYVTPAPRLPYCPECYWEYHGRFGSDAAELFGEEQHC